MPKQLLHRLGVRFLSDHHAVVATLSSELLRAVPGLGRLLRKLGASAIAYSELLLEAKATRDWRTVVEGFRAADS